jgi:hypothetical protein
MNKCNAGDHVPQEAAHELEPYNFTACSGCPDVLVSLWASSSWCVYNGSPPVWPWLWTGRARTTTARGSSIIQRYIGKAASRGRYSASVEFLLFISKTQSDERGYFHRLIIAIEVRSKISWGSSGAAQRSIQDLRGSDVPNLRQGCPTLARYGPQYATRGKGTNGLLDLQYAPVTPKKLLLPDGTWKPNVAGEVIRLSLARLVLIAPLLPSPPLRNIHFHTWK